MDESPQDNTLFRTPTIQESEKVAEPNLQAQTNEKVGISEVSSDDTPPSVLAEMKRPPYLLELFEATDTFKQFHVEEQSIEIDGFVIREMERKGLNDTRENYKKIVDDLFENITQADNVYDNIESLLIWVRIQSKLIEAAEEKIKFLEKDPEVMTASELKRLLEGRT